LETLSHSRGDAVYVRALSVQRRPALWSRTGRQLNKLNWEQVVGQAEGYGIYIANGGGHADKDITAAALYLCEFDDRPIEDQISFRRVS